jgi:hypothetical protein
MITIFVALATICLAVGCWIWSSKLWLNLFIKLGLFCMMVYGIICFVSLVKV